MSEAGPGHRDLITAASPGAGRDRDALWRKTCVLCAVLALSAVLVELFLTRNGVGVTPDSVVYLGAARSIRDGFGVSMSQGDGSHAPVTHFPPLLPFVLAVPGILGVEPIVAIRWLNCLLFGANALLVGLLVHWHTRSCGAAIGGTLLFILSGDMLLMHSMAWSEPGFIFVMLLSLGLLGVYFETNRCRFLIGAALAVGLSVLDRYVGAALVGAGIAGLLLLGRAKRRGRISACLAFGAIACLPTVVWTMRNMVLAHTAAGRPFAVHLISWGSIREGLEAAAHWFLPSLLPAAFKVTAACVALAAMAALSGRVLWAERKRAACGESDARSPRMPHIFLLAIFCYFAFLMVSISFMDAATPLDTRLMSPLYPLVIVAALATVCWVLFRLQWSGAVTALAGAAIILLMVGGRAVKTAPWMMKRSLDGTGYTSRAWKESETLQQLQAVPEGIPIYSNATVAIYFLTGRSAHEIPSEISRISLQPASDFDVRLREMGEDLRLRNGVLVIFSAMEGDQGSSWEEELAVRLRLKKKTEARDGRIYVSDQR